MVSVLVCMLFLILQTTRALPLDAIASSDTSPGRGENHGVLAILCLVFFLLILHIVLPVLRIILPVRHHDVALNLTVCLSLRESKFNAPSLPQGTAQPFTNAPSDTVVVELSVTADSSAPLTESALSVVLSAVTDDEDQSVELSTLASFHTASQHSLAPSNTSTLRSPPDSWVGSAPSIVLSVATGDEHQSVDLSMSASTSFYSASEHSLTSSITSTIRDSPSDSWVSDTTTFVQQPLQRSW
ncbi:hypothetical protein C8R45DRAFT_1012535 [Mycena sanguinolenta]|nr:hypothetical protein C8R45DRAFT_1012535 [Mycena sanguinolenta]